MGEYRLEITGLGYYRIEGFWDSRNEIPVSIQTKRKSPWQSKLQAPKHFFSRPTLASPANHMFLNSVWSPQFYWAGGCGRFRMRSLISCDVVVWPILISFLLLPPPPPPPSSKCLIRSLLVYCQSLQHLWFPPFSFSDLFLFPHVPANLCNKVTVPRRSQAPIKFRLNFQLSYLS